MTITEQILAVRDGLKNWAEALGGEVVIAIDSAQMWDIAVISQDFPRVILCFDEQEVRGEASDVLGKVYNHFHAMVTRQRGYDQDVGTDLAGSDGANQGSSPPFYDLVEQARDAIRLTQITDPGDPDTEQPVWYKGTDKVPYDPDVPIYGYIIKFCIGTNIGDLVPMDRNN